MQTPGLAPVGLFVCLGLAVIANYCCYAAGKEEYLLVKLEDDKDPGPGINEPPIIIDDDLG